MGSDFGIFMTFEQAATRLGRSKRSIHTYVKNGFIRREVQGGEVVLLAEDVEQVAVDSGKDMPAFNRKNFFHLMQRLKKLEEDMSVMRHMLDIRDNPLRFTKVTEAVGLQHAAIAALKANSWTTQEISLWADLFARFDEVTLTKLGEALVTTRPWDVFYKLCLNMMSFVSLNKEPSWQVAHKQLDEGRKRLRSNVLMWIEMGLGTVPDSVFREVNNDKEDLLRRL